MVTAMSEREALEKAKEAIDLLADEDWRHDVSFRDETYKATGIANSAISAALAGEGWGPGAVERIAAQAHEAWSGWMRWMLPKLDGPDAASWRERWERQMNTAYADLSEAEKESDRNEARKYLRAALAADDWTPINQIPEEWKDGRALEVYGGTPDGEVWGLGEAEAPAHVVTHDGHKFSLCDTECYTVYICNPTHVREITPPKEDKP